MEKVTEKVILGVIKSVFEGAEEIAIDPALVIEYCDKKVAQIEQKAEKAKERAAEKRAEGDALTDIVRQVLTDEFQTNGDLAAKVSEIVGEGTSKQKVGYRVRQLVANGEAVETDVTTAAEDGKKVTRKAYKLAD